MTDKTELIAAIKLIMQNGCTAFDDCSACPLCDYHGVPGAPGDLCCSIEMVK